VLSRFSGIKALTRKIGRFFRPRVARSGAINGGEVNLAGMTMARPPTREDVFNGWRFILGRDPNEEMVDAFMRQPNVAGVRRELIRSAEFHDIFVRENLRRNRHPDAERRRAAIVFMHLEKTGGTSLRVALDANFAVDRICPIHFNDLHNMSVAELGRYDFFKGHFDYASIRFIPRDDIKIISLFRDPGARLVSVYRSLRSRPVIDEFRDNTFVGLANSLSIEEFFEHPETRSHSNIDNYYLRVFGCSPSGVENLYRLPSPDSERPAELDAARRNIRQLTALGITERFDDSARLIFNALSIPLPESVVAQNVTDNYPSLDPRGKKVEPVIIRQRLADALQELVRYDSQLYLFAREEFERRWVDANLA
jgi:hypothetical protein